MAESHAGDTPPGTKRCKACREPINAEAKKCIHCDSYQDWRANLGFSSTVLSLLIALITVSTAAIPVLKNAVVEKNSDIRVAYAGANEKLIAVLASNLGVRSGSIGTRPTLNVSAGKKTDLVAAYFVAQGSKEQAAVVIDPGKSRLLEFRVSYLSREFSWAELNKSDCTFSFDIADYRGRETTIELYVWCGSIRPMLGSDPS